MTAPGQQQSAGARRQGPGAAQQAGGSAPSAGGAEPGGGGGSGGGRSQGTFRLLPLAIVKPASQAALKPPPGYAAVVQPPTPSPAAPQAQPPLPPALWADGKQQLGAGGGDLVSYIHSTVFALPLAVASWLKLQLTGADRG